MKITTISLFFFTLLASPLAHAVTLTCEPVSIGDSAELEVLIVSINPGPYEMDARRDGSMFYRCKLRGKKYVYLSERSSIEAGFFGSNFEAKRLILNCPFVSQRQLIKHGNRVIRTMGAETGFFATAGMNTGFDNRGNACNLVFVGLEGGGLRAGWRSFNVEISK